tara:strand:- start:473 stop:727 length:255 start_codon:yes stop_codon:yes gene_type:complete
MSRQIWQTVEVEVDLEGLGMDEEQWSHLDMESDADVLEFISWVDGDSYEVVKELVDEQIGEGDDWVDEERVEHSLDQWKIEIKK